MKVKTKRNPAIELYRCVLMFGICMLHAAITPGCGRVWLINLLCSCVDGFVFITGFYGCRFKPSKVLKLLLTGMFCAMVCAKGDIKETVLIFGGYWFLHAYVLMMVFAPLVDGMLEKSINLKVMLPLLVVIFIWGFSPTLPIIGWIVPKTAGLTGYSGLTLLGIYVLGRMYKLLGLQNRMRTLYVLPATVVLAVLCALGLNEYNSPTSALLAGCCFFLFFKIKMHGIAAEIVFMLAPSVFAIYLLHQPGRFFLQYNFVNGVVEKGWNVYMAYFAAVAIMFWGSAILDIPRRIMAKCVVVAGGKGSSAIDDLWERLCDKAERHLSK